jgi:endogenous inhibitor of DNA gyrase (YacG/DUF329 family)
MSQPSSPCPICGRPRDEKLRPFCSKRCADIDLGRWLKGEYTIPGAPPGEEGPGGEDEAPEIH